MYSACAVESEVDFCKREHHEIGVEPRKTIHPVVDLESYFTVDVNKTEVVSGSTNSGLTDTTLYFFNCAFIMCIFNDILYDHTNNLEVLCIPPYIFVRFRIISDCFF